MHSLLPPAISPCCKMMQCRVFSVSTHGTRAISEMLREPYVSCCVLFCCPACCPVLASGLLATTYFPSQFSAHLLITAAPELDWAQCDCVVGRLAQCHGGGVLLMGSASQDVERSFCSCVFFMDLCNQLFQEKNDVWPSKGWAEPDGSWRAVMC